MVSGQTPRFSRQAKTRESSCIAANAVARRLINGASPSRFRPEQARGIMQDPLTANGNRPPMLVWREGIWRCELHPSATGWRYHLFRGEELVATRAKASSGDVDRGEALRQCVSLRDALLVAKPPEGTT
jgi:hypothetical protein